MRSELFFSWMSSSWILVGGERPLEPLGESTSSISPRPPPSSMAVFARSKWEPWFLWSGENISWLCSFRQKLLYVLRSNNSDEHYECGNNTNEDTLYLGVIGNSSLPSGNSGPEVLSTSYSRAEFMSIRPKIRNAVRLTGFDLCGSGRDHLITITIGQSKLRQ